MVIRAIFAIVISGAAPQEASVTGAGRPIDITIAGMVRQS